MDQSFFQLGGATRRIGKLVGGWLLPAALICLFFSAPGCGGSSQVAPPSITTQPTDQTALDGTAATFSVTASGESLEYQWSRNGAPLAGATQTSYTTSKLVYSADHGATFNVVITNPAGKVNSNTVKLNVTASPTVLTGPSEQTAMDGSTATFTVSATGTGPFAYQWKRNGTVLPGATAATYTTPLLVYALDNNAQYSVVATNGASQPTSSGQAKVIVTPKPTLLVGPGDQSAVDGSTTTFSVIASGTGPFTYQWKRNGVELPGATAAAYTTPPLVYATDNNAQYSVVVTNGAGQPTSSGLAKVTVTQQVTQIVGPSDQSAVDGSIATFSVSATGTGPFSYRWKRNGAELPGATAAAYSTPLLVYAADNNAQYSVVVTNVLGQASESRQAKLTVTPKITQLDGPNSQTIRDGATATFTVSATGTGPFTYQWRCNGIDVPGATAATYKTTFLFYLKDNNSLFSVVVTNVAGQATISGQAKLTITPRVTQLVGPSDQSVVDGSTATFTVSASGTGPFIYQWKRNGADLPGATATSYTTPALVYATDNGTHYSVAVTNGANQVETSPAATLTVTPIMPVFTTQPIGGSFVEGSTVVLTCAATGTGPLVYQWKLNTADLPGMTSPSLTLSPIRYADAGSYTVVATGPAGSVTSDAAVLVVTSDLAIQNPPVDQTVTAPDGATFTVVASGFGPFTYQWRKNGSAIPGAIASSYTTGATDLKMVPDSYTVVVSDDITSIESLSVTFTVVAPNPFYLPGGEPVAVPSRPLTVLPSLHVDPVKFPNGAFRLGYDETLKNPAWTAYADFKVNSTFPNSTGDYQTDTRLDAPQVAKASMGTHGSMFYLANGQGFDRGHMAMRSDVAYRYNQQAGDDATYMSNLVAQVSYYNQHLWNDLEEAVGGKFVGGVFNNGVTAIFGRTWVYTGPVFTGTTDFWVPSTETYTKSPMGLPAGTLAIAIPTACYKIVVAEPAAGQTLPRVMVWLSSNRSYATAESADIWKYTTTVKRVEELTGLDFFPGLPHDAALSTWKATVDVRGWGPDFEKATGPNVHILQPSWDLIPITTNPILKGDTVKMGDSIPFEAAVMPNQAGGTVDTATGCSWTFGDGPTATLGLTTTHIYASAGSFTATFSATDDLGHTNTITRVVTVVDPSNAPPTMSPTTLANVSVRVGNAVPPVAFTVADDYTPPGSLLVTALSSDQSLVADDQLVVTNTAGAISLAITPVAAQLGSATITVTVTDASGASLIKIFTFSVVSNAAPTFTPTTLPDSSTTTGTTKTVTFSVADDATPAGSITVTATSGNTTLLLDSNITVGNVGGAITLTLVPEAGLTGTALITVTATDGEAAATVKTFTLTVAPPAEVPKLIISQYYEGTSNNKWIEITNVGSTTFNAADTPLYAWLWSNPYNATGGSYSTYALSGTIAPGASILLFNSAAVLPTPTFVTGTGISTGVANFNGDDVVFLSPDATGTLGATAYSHRTDVIGINDSVIWMGNTGTTAGSNWNLVKGLDRSYVRAFSVTAPNPTFTFSEWIQVDAAQIKTTNPSLVDSAAVGTTNRLGYHSYSGGNP